MPSLTTVTLNEGIAFKMNSTFHTNCYCSSYLLFLGNIGEMVEFLKENCTVKECWSDAPVRLNVEVIDIGDKMCNKVGDQIELSRYVNVKNVTIGNECFEYQEVLNLTGLNMLERVVIGENSFTRYKDDWPSYNNTARRFYLKDCEQLNELIIGHHSFSDFSVCKIENVPSLEVIEMGNMNRTSDNFYYASLQLKSAGDELK